MTYEELVAWLVKSKLNGFRFAMDDAIMAEATSLRTGVMFADYADRAEHGPEMLDYVTAIQDRRDLFITQFISELISLAKEPQPTFVVTASDVLLYPTKSIARALAWEYSKRK